LDPAASTRIQVCGRLVVVWSGERVEQRLPSRQGRLLFAYLVLNRHRPRSRAALVDAVWPVEPPGTTDSALNALLSKLRGVLGREAIAGRDEPRLVLPPDAYVDLEAAAEHVHQAESATSMGDWHRAWAPARAALHTAERGFLEGHDAPWIDEVARSLEDLRLRALECVAAAGLGLGGPELAATERAARALIAASPLRESGYVHLMRALMARESFAEAMLVYDRLRTSLRDELGIAPSARVQALHAELLQSA
jgi:SARP family transcriptional regulator, regulator of embCAB operon